MGDKANAGGADQNAGIAGRGDRGHREPRGHRGLRARAAEQHWHEVRGAEANEEETGYGYSCARRQQEYGETCDREQASPHQRCAIADARNDDVAAEPAPTTTWSPTASPR